MLAAFNKALSALGNRHRHIPWLLEVRSSPIFVTLVCGVAIFTDTFIYGVVVPVLPFTLTVRINVPSAKVEQWTSILLACYGAGFLLACPAVGWITDHAPSRRTVFAFAVLQLVVSTILLCLGSSIAVFVIARVLQGGSSAITWTAGLALLVDTVGQHRLGRAMGFCSVGMNAALLLAPFVGGMVLDRSGYVSVFVITLGVIAVDLVLRFLVVEKVNAQQYFKKTTSYWIITYGFHGTPSISPSPCAEIGELEAPLLASYEEPTCDDPPEPACSNARRCRKLPPVISLLRFGRLRVLLWVTLVEITVMTAFDAVLPLFTHKVFGWGSVGAGLIFVPLVLPALTAPWIGDLSDRYGARLFILAGFVSATPTLVTLRVISNNTIGHIILLCTLLSLLSLAMALIMAPVMAEIMYVVEAEEKQQPGIFGRKGAYAQAYALYAFASAAGLLLGPCLGGLLTEAAGWGTMTLTLGLLCAVTAVPVFYWL